MNLSGGNSQNSTLTLDVVPCQEYFIPLPKVSIPEDDGSVAQDIAIGEISNSECEQLRAEDLIRLYSPPEPGTIDMMLQYNISGLRNESGIRDIDLLTDYSKKIISEIAADNRTIINQIAPTELDGKKAIRISYDAPMELEIGTLCCEHFTRIIVLGNNHIYEISYSLDNHGQFRHIPELEEIIENTKLTGPFTPGQLVPGSSPLG
jgi:hypothetical protein